MIPYEYFVNESTLNIFTDASIVHKTAKTQNGECKFYVGSPGSMLYIGDKLVDEYHSVLPDCTNNQSEITAILYGVQRGLSFACMNSFIKNINIFSDSKICIYGLREWIFKWIKNMNNGVLYSTSGEVINQYIFVSIIKHVIDGNRDIRFYHVRGHCNPLNFKDRVKFRNSFMKENYLDAYIEDRLIDFFISANDAVDNITRDELHRLPEDFLTTGYISTDMIVKSHTNPHKDRIFNWNEFIRSLDLNKYKKLIGGI